jgi:predicted Zn-dependent peptidase
MRGEAGRARSARKAQSRVEWPRENPPRPLPARPVTFPPYEIRKLANGMQVVLVSQNEQPVVSVRMIIRAGAAHDPKARTAWRC